MIFRDTLVDLRLYHRQKIFIIGIDQVDPRRAKVSDRLPDVNRDGDHDAVIARLELHPFQFQINMVVIETLVIEVKFFPWVMVDFVDI